MSSRTVLIPATPPHLIILSSSFSLDFSSLFLNTSHIWTRPSPPGRGRRPGRLCPDPPPRVVAVVRSAVDASVLGDRRTVLVGGSRDPERPGESSSSHEADSGRPDEDEPDMPDGFRHLFGILYPGHLLFPKYVPAR